MKLVYLLSSLLLFQATVSSQEFATLIEKGQELSDFTYYDNYIYVVGQQSSSGGTYFSKLDTAGNIIWEKNIDDGFYYYNNKANTITNDGQGNIYIGGEYRGNVDFGGVNLNSPSPSGVTGGNYFIAKYDTNGNLIWVNEGGGDANTDDVLDIKVDDNQNCYVSGFVSGTVDFNNSALIFPGNQSSRYPFLAKYDLNGNLIFFNRPEVTHPSNSGSELAIDANGDLIFGGFYSDSLIYEGDTLVSRGGKDLFCYKFSSTGQLLNAISAGSIGNELIGGIESDQFGNFYIAGNYSENFYIDSIVLSKNTPDNSFIIKYNANNDILWAKSGIAQNPFGGGGGFRSYISDIATDVYGNVHAIGTLDTDYSVEGNTVYSNGRLNEVFSFKLNENGYFQFLHDFGVANDDFSKKIEYINDSCYITLNTSEGTDLIFSGFSTSLTYNNILIMAVDTSSYECISAMSQFNKILQADVLGYSYQWLDCDNNYSIILSETEDTFIPNESGNYALEVSLNTCKDTSNCDYVFLCDSYDTLSVFHCGSSYSSPSGMYVWNSSGIYNDVIPNSMGCDSILTIDLTLSPELTMTVTREGRTMIADQTGVYYQWLDCDNSYSPIIGETYESFTSISDGNFAVEITSPEGCVDTTTCYNLTNTSLHFDGNDDKAYKLSEINDSLTDGKLTLEVWLNPQSWATLSTGATIYESCGSGSGSDANFIVSTGNNGQVNFTINPGVGELSLVSSTGLLNLNIWNHLAVSYDGTEIKLYLNGVATDSLNSGLTLNTVSGYENLGNDYYGATPYHGKMDELKIWNTCRTPSEIQYDMISDYCSRPDGLLVYYKFDDGFASQDNTMGSTVLINKYHISKYMFRYNFADIGTNSNFVEGTSVTSSYLPNTDVILSGDTLISANNGGSYQWLNCADNSSIAGASEHFFLPQEDGNYSVAMNVGGCIDTSVCVQFDFCEIEASFNYVDNGGGNYSFTNTSFGNHNQYKWYFGDGTTSGGTDANHTFLANGTYTVVLGIEDTTNLPQNSCQDYYYTTIEVTDVPVSLSCNAGFTVYPDTIPNTLVVVNSSTGTNLSYSWDFGDGTILTSPTPSHVYSTNGPYFLCLSIDDGTGCTSTYCDSVSNTGSIFKAFGFTINVISANDISTSIEENGNNTISIFPIPVNEKLNISYQGNEELDVKVFDLNGKRYDVKLTSPNTIDVSFLSAGMYFIQISIESNNSILKFIKN